MGLCESKWPWAEREYAYFSRPDERGFTLKCDLVGTSSAVHHSYDHTNETHIRVRSMPDGQVLVSMDELLKELLRQNILLDTALIRCYGTKVQQAVHHDSGTPLSFQDLFDDEGNAQPCGHVYLTFALGPNPIFE